MSPISAEHVVMLNPPAETTESILKGLGRSVVHESGPGSTVAGENDYAIDRQRMLDAEEVAIKRIVRTSLAALFAKQAGGN